MNMMQNQILLITYQSATDVVLIEFLSLKSYLLSFINCKWINMQRKVWRKECNLVVFAYLHVAILHVMVIQNRKESN